MVSLVILKRILILIHLMVNETLKRMILLTSTKDCSSPSAVEKVHKPITCLPPFSHRLKKKDQINVDNIRETFSQVKINNPLLNAIPSLC